VRNCGRNGKIYASFPSRQQATRHSKLIHILFERCKGMMKPLSPPLGGGGGGNVPVVTGSHFLPFFRPMGAPIQWSGRGGFQPPPSPAMVRSVSMPSATPDLTLHGKTKTMSQRPAKKASTAKKAPSSGYNRKKLSQSSSIYRGVLKKTGETSWRACGKYRGKFFHLGCFDTEKEAARAYDQWASVTFRDQAVLNFDPNTGQRNHNVKGENESIYKGVSRHKKKNKWQANVWNKILKKNIHVGRFDDEKDAAKAYDRAALDILGDQAVLNFDPITGQPNPHVILRQRNRLKTLGMVQQQEDDMLRYLDEFYPQHQQQQQRGGGGGGAQQGGGPTLPMTHAVRGRREDTHVFYDDYDDILEV
jgi:hypothetical protein